MKNFIKALFVFIVVVCTFLIFVFIGAVYPTFRAFSNSCPSETKTFEYGGCSVNYDVITKNEKCAPCGGVMPCITGFEQNKKITILKCLCAAGKTEDAINFASIYMRGQPYRFKKNNILSEENTETYIEQPLSDYIINNICKNIPEVILPL
jgi:hypothetical protein